MKNLFSYVLILLACTLCMCEEAPESTISVTAAFPSANPIGGPVKIVGNGFTNETIVFFDGVMADIELRSDTFLTTKVPTGVGGSGVSINLEDPGGAAVLSDYFDVLASFPSNLPSSPPSIFIPTQTLNSSLPFTMTGSEGVWHMNVYDTQHRLVLLFSRVNSEDRSFEFVEIDGTSYSSPVLMDGQELLDYNPSNGEINLSVLFIDRTNLSTLRHPFSSDEYSATYFTDENFSFPSEFKENSGDITPSKNFLLLESKTTFRQYLFVVYCPPFTFCG